MLDAGRVYVYKGTEKNFHDRMSITNPYILNKINQKKDSSNGY